MQTVTLRVKTHLWEPWLGIHKCLAQSYFSVLLLHVPVTLISQNTRQSSSLVNQAYYPEEIYLQCVFNSIMLYLLIEKRGMYFFRGF